MKLYLLAMVILSLVYAQDDDFHSDDPLVNPNKKDEI